MTVTWENAENAMSQTPSVPTDGERADLLAELASSRFFLVNTTRGLTDEQAASRPTVSELCLGGLIKHVASVEENWVTFVLEGAGAFGGGWEMPEGDDAEMPDWAVERAKEFRLLPGETVAGVVGRYQEVAARTERIVAGLPSLDLAHPLPEAPWFEPGASWTARRVLLHVISETSQHAGHADVLREAIDGAKSMG